MATTATAASKAGMAPHSYGWTESQLGRASHFINQMQSNIPKYLATISPYSNVFKQPHVSASATITGAVYLFRHGILEVSQHDYSAWIAPFLRKLEGLQRAGKPFVQGRLEFLAHYRSWISAAHVGMVSEAGLQQSSDLGTAFRTRYKQWLVSAAKEKRQNSSLAVWTDAAARCHRSATAFAGGFSGKATEEAKYPPDKLRQVDTRVKVLTAENGDKSCDNLCWHKAFSVDQEAGHDQMIQLMNVTAQPALERLSDAWLEACPLTVQDIYSMQLLHCYDIVSGRESPFQLCFDDSDWVAFEYLRDTKTYFSEGYGSSKSSIYAIPWTNAAMRTLSQTRQSDHDLPLRVAFTHREEVLYLCCLLGICFEKDWRPSLDSVDENRQWRVSLLAPYLGHVGIETYIGNSMRERLRIIINGEVRPAFFGKLRQDEDGGYEIHEVDAWTQQKVQRWEDLEGGSLSFLDG